MTVELWFAPTYRFEGGFRSTFASLEEAMAQAVADLQSNREPPPVRIQSEDGEILADAKSFKDALAQE